MAYLLTFRPSSLCLYAYISYLYAHILCWYIVYFTIYIFLTEDKFHFIKCVFPDTFGWSWCAGSITRRSPSLLHTNISSRTWLMLCLFITLSLHVLYVSCWLVLCNSSCDNKHLSRTNFLHRTLVIGQLVLQTLFHHTHSLHVLDWSSCQFESKIRIVFLFCTNLAYTA